MHIVIKGTKTVEEYQQLYKQMETMATDFYHDHRKNYENWENGDIAKVWYDHDRYLCIEYENGKWWHYDRNGEWF